jgi:hypothetical protein
VAAHLKEADALNAGFEILLPREAIRDGMTVGPSRSDVSPVTTASRFGRVRSFGIQARRRAGGAVAAQGAAWTRAVGREQDGTMRAGAEAQARDLAPGPYRG